MDVKIGAVLLVQWSNWQPCFFAALGNANCSQIG